MLCSGRITELSRVTKRAARHAGHMFRYEPILRINAAASICHEATKSDSLDLADGAPKILNPIWHPVDNSVETEKLEDRFFKMFSNIRHALFKIRPRVRYDRPMPGTVSFKRNGP